MHAHSSALPLSPTQRQELSTLSGTDRVLVTPEALARWSSDLAESDYSLADIVAFEKRRREALQSLRSTAELTQMEWQLLRYLQRHEGTTRTYLQIARHLWSTAERPVVAAWRSPVRSVGPRRRPIGRGSPARSCPRVATAPAPPSPCASTRLNARSTPARGAVARGSARSPDGDAAAAAPVGAG
jgi:hypothetical protein